MVLHLFISVIVVGLDGLNKLAKGTLVLTRIEQNTLGHSLNWCILKYCVLLN